MKVFIPEVSKTPLHPYTVPDNASLDTIGCMCLRNGGKRRQLAHGSAAGVGSNPVYLNCDTCTTIFARCHTWWRAIWSGFRCAIWREHVSGPDSVLCRRMTRFSLFDCGQVVPSSFTLFSRIGSRPCDPRKCDVSNLSILGDYLCCSNNAPPQRKSPGPCRLPKGAISPT